MKSIDIFGLKYDLLIEGQNMLQTKTGGQLAIIYFFIVIGLFFSFGMDLYLRKNPKVSLNNLVPDDYEYINLNNSNATLAYRIEDVNGQFYKNNSIIQDFKLSLFSLKLNSLGIWDLISTNLIQPKMCKDLPNVDEVQENYNWDLTYWYCIDFNDVNNLGGNWDGKFVKYLQIETFQCTNSTSNNYSCASLDTIQTEINNNVTKNLLFFSYLYMNGIAKVSNVSYPISTSLVNHYDALDVRVSKRKYQIYKRIQLDSDNGWLFPKIDTTMIYCLGDEFSDFVLKDPQTNNLLQTTIIYFGKNIDSYSRSFTKIQEVFAQIGGFSSMLKILLSVLYEKMGIVLMNKKIMKRISLANSHIIPKNPTHIQIKEDPQNNNIVNKSRIFFENNLNKDNDDSSISSLGKKFESLDLKKLISFNKRKISVSFCLYLKSLCRKMTDSQKLIIDDFNKNKEYIENVFDVVTLVKFYKEFQFLKEIILNEHQIIALELIKPKLENKDRNKEISQKKLIEYFTSIQKEKKINEKDRKLIESIIEEEIFDSSLN